MSTKVPVLKKYYFDKSAFIERKLPRPGNLLVSTGSVVNSFDKLGEARIVKDTEKVDFSGICKVKKGERVYPGDVLAVAKKYLFSKKEYKTTLSGTVSEIDKTKGTIQIDGLSSNFTLISGVSGEVVDTLDETSILIKSPAVVVKAVAGVGEEVAGELVYIKTGVLSSEDITERVKGKIVVANTANAGAISKAKALGILGFVLGSLEHVEYTKLDQEDFSILLLEGFGSMPISEPLLNYFKQIDSKFAAIRTYENMLIIPGEDILKIIPKVRESYFESEITVGDYVQIFNKEHYGKTGKVIEVKTDTVIVVVDGNNIEAPAHMLGVLA
jgi:hypothetical protein